MSAVQTALLLGLLLTVTAPHPAVASAGGSPPSAAGPAPHRLRAETVAAAAADLRTEVRDLRLELDRALARDAPDLARLLDPPPAETAPSGYQVLPDLVPLAREPPRTIPDRAISSTFSWPLTERLVTDTHGRVARLRAAIAAGASGPPGETDWRALVESYRALSRLLALAEAQVGYNRFWQEAVAADRGRFDRQTRLHDLVLRRQDLRRALRAGGSALAEAARRFLGGEAVDSGAADLAGRLARLEREWTEELAAAESMDAPAPGLRAHLRQGVTELVLVLASDVADHRFLRRLEREVEAVWRVADGETLFRLDLRLSRLSPRRLYRGVSPPAPGAPIDLTAHLARFPAGSAVLTTGATTTHAFVGRHILLGPGELGARVLAHEIGHLLGFRDGYFRGYRDLGADGFAILEIVPDPEDLMSAPGLGHVSRHHFDRVLARLAASATEPSPPR